MSLQTPFAYFSLSKPIRVQPLPGGSGRPASAVKIEDGADEETDLQRWGERIHVHPDTQLPGISPYITAGFDGRPTLSGQSAFSQHTATHRFFMLLACSLFLLLLSFIIMIRRR